MGYSSIFQSRRTLFATCDWWSQKLVTNAANGRPDYSKLAHEVRPTGHFRAEETAPISENPQEMADVRYTGRTVTLSTTDDVMGKLFRDDLVRYDGRIWRVTYVTLQRDWRKSQFGNRSRSGVVVIGLRG